MTKAMLERLGHTVLAASTADEAIRLTEMHQGRIHLLLTDVVLPGENGMDLGRRLLKRRPHLKPLFMSGYLPENIYDHGMLEAGARFIQKPFSMKDLSIAVQQAVQLPPPRRRSPQLKRCLFYSAAEAILTVRSHHHAFSSAAHPEAPHPDHDPAVFHPRVLPLRKA
jgi:DNA-binding NtrC family response regulator